jgi:hypothetical protein
MSRVTIAITLVSVAMGLACGPDKPASAPTTGPGGTAPPTGPGYDDLRPLARDDCTALRDHQIELAATDAIKGDDASKVVDPIERERLEQQLRVRKKEETTEWVKRCTGRAVTAATLRCMRESRSVVGFNACGSASDAGVDDAGGADVGAP